MLKKILLVLAMIASSVILMAAPAHAAGCVTLTEWQFATQGKRMKPVHDYFGTTGSITQQRQKDGWRYQTRVYDWCTHSNGFFLIVWEKRATGDSTWQLGAKTG